MRRGTSPRAARAARGALLAAIVLLHLVILAAPWVAPYDPAAQATPAGQPMTAPQPAPLRRSDQKSNPIRS